MSEEPFRTNWNVFVDESIHVRGDFIVVAAVCAEDGVQDRIVAALTDCGFDPTHDEFKSSMTMDGAPAAQRLRAHLKMILRECKVAVAVCPTSERAEIAAHVARLLSTIDADPGRRVVGIHLDEGIKRTSAPFPRDATIHFGCDS